LIVAGNRKFESSSLQRRVGSELGFESTSLRQRVRLYGSCGTIRLKLLKIGALVRTSVRRIKLAIPSAFPYQAAYRAAHAALTAAAA
jgi:hypothetical protein